VRITTLGFKDEISSRWRPAGIFGGGSPDVAAILQFVFQKNTHFKKILAQISAETLFLNV